MEDVLERELNHGPRGTIPFKAPLTPQSAPYFIGVVQNTGLGFYKKHGRLYKCRPSRGSVEHMTADEAEVVVSSMDVSWDAMGFYQSLPSIERTCAAALVLSSMGLAARKAPPIMPWYKRWWRRMTS